MIICAPLGVWIAFNHASTITGFLRDTLIFTLALTPGYLAAIFAFSQISAVLEYLLSAGGFAALVFIGLFAVTFASILVAGYTGGLPMLVLFGYLESLPDVWQTAFSGGYLPGRIMLLCAILIWLIPISIAIDPVKSGVATYFTHAVWQGMFCGILTYSCKYRR